MGTHHQIIEGKRENKNGHNSPRGVEIGDFECDERDGRTCKNIAGHPSGIG